MSRLQGSTGRPKSVRGPRMFPVKVHGAAPYLTSETRREYTGAPYRRSKFVRVTKMHISGQKRICRSTVCYTFIILSYMLMERGVSVCAPRRTLSNQHSLSLCKIYFSNALTNRSSRLYPKAPLAFTALSRCFIAFPPQRTPAAMFLAPLAKTALNRSFTTEHSTTFATPRYTPLVYGSFTLITNSNNTSSISQYCVQSNYVSEATNTGQANTKLGATGRNISTPSDSITLIGNITCRTKHSLSLCKIYFSNALTNRSSCTSRPIRY
jgi:hypothetical protein